MMAIGRSFSPRERIVPMFDEELEGGQSLPPIVLAHDTEGACEVP
mgnify:FL=1